MLDRLNGISWAAAYLVICSLILKNRGEKKGRLLYMPPIAGSLAIAWEANAVLYSGGHWAHILWFTLDIVIFAHNLLRIDGVKDKAGYGTITLFVLFAFRAAFVSTSLSNAMLITAYAIDVVIALEYVLRSSEIAREGKLAVGILRLFGDACAWLAYLHLSVFVGISGLVVLLLNTFYLSICLGSGER